MKNSYISSEIFGILIMSKFKFLIIALTFMAVSGNAFAAVNPPKAMPVEKAKKSVVKPKVNPVDKPVVDLNPIVTEGAVDLGLSVQWAACNVGANSPEGAGIHFGWADPSGENETEDVQDADGNWNSKLYGGVTPLTNICFTAFDMATANLGREWRLPSHDELKELCDSCKWTWTRFHGVRGMKITGKTGKSIFLPAVGDRMSLDDEMYRSYYWSGTLSDVDKTSDNAWHLYFDRYGNKYCSFDLRCSGYVVRAVKAKATDK
jgi:hypothetical protein